MPWPTFEVDSWARFAELAARLTFPHPGDVSYLMRGQADAAWTLTPSLLRYLPAEATSHQALQVESIGAHEFQAQAHLHLPGGSLPSPFPVAGLPEWWALMQHYHAPTRLLDWTQSPYVAAYYAVEALVDTPGAIFIIRTQTVEAPLTTHFKDGKVRNDNFRDPAAPMVLLTWSPQRKTDRFVAQQGYFTLSVNVLGVHDKLIVEACGAARAADRKTLFYEKWVIPARLKLEFLRNLRAMNIAAHSLFPGIDGLGRSLAEVARLAAIVKSAPNP